jgi:hypothetical protein
MANPIGLLSLLAAVSVAPVAWAQGVAFESGVSRVGLLELYTSEGCSSCPPAEAWLAKLRGDPGLWREFVPIAFHVNYWDRLGWRDRFSSKEFTDRQYAYAQTFRSNSVYTPCFIFNGEEWHPTGGERPEGSASAKAGRLRVEWNGRDRVRISFEPAVTRGIYEAYLALLGGGLSSKVTAGENSGESLTHEFVVLKLSKIPLTKAGDSLQSGQARWSGVPPESVPRLALAAWVAKKGDLNPIQATGGWIKLGAW